MLHGFRSTPSGRYLYATNEVADYVGKSGCGQRLCCGSAAWETRAVEHCQLEGAGPAHLSVDASGKYVFVANYAGGTRSRAAHTDDRSPWPSHVCSPGYGLCWSHGPSTAPPGSFAFSGHDSPHAHMIQADPGNRFVLQTDLGQDRIYVSTFDPWPGKLSPLADSPFFAASG